MLRLYYACSSLRPRWTRPFVQQTSISCTKYVVGDAFAEGFMVVTQYPDRELSSRDGLWDVSFAAGGSNLREAQNHVNHLLLEIREGRHDGCEIWAATDNAVFSQVFNKGMSSARHFFCSRWN